MATKIEALDELIALASHAGMLQSEATTAHALAYGKRDRRLTARATKSRKDATIAEQKLNAARELFLTNTSEWDWSAELTIADPMLKPVQSRSGERNPDAAASPHQLAIDVARVALQAVPFTYDDEGRRWAYFAEESRSWWAITTDSMIQLADILAQSTMRPTHDKYIIEAWAEADKSAIEVDHVLQRRLSREHGR